MGRRVWDEGGAPGEKDGHPWALQWEHKSWFWAAERRPCGWPVSACLFQLIRKKPEIMFNIFYFIRKLFPLGSNKVKTVYHWKYKLQFGIVISYKHWRIFSVSSTMLSAGDTNMSGSQSVPLGTCTKQWRNRVNDQSQLGTRSTLVGVVKGQGDAYGKDWFTHGLSCLEN